MLHKKVKNGENIRNTSGRNHTRFDLWIGSDTKAPWVSGQPTYHFIHSHKGPSFSHLGDP